MAGRAVLDDGIVIFNGRNGVRQMESIMRERSCKNENVITVSEISGDHGACGWTWKLCGTLYATVSYGTQ